MKSDCHICNQQSSNLARCAKTRCRNFFCEHCIQLKFDATYKYNIHYKEGFWICYACQNMCVCNLCRGDLIIHPKRTKKAITAQSESKLESNMQEQETLSPEQDEPDERLKVKHKINKNQAQYNQRTTKPLPTVTKSYFFNKFYRRKIILKLI